VLCGALADLKESNSVCVFGLTDGRTPLLASVSFAPLEAANRSDAVIGLLGPVLSTLSIDSLVLCATPIGAGLVGVLGAFPATVVGPAKFLPPNCPVRFAGVAGIIDNVLPSGVDTLCLG